MPLSVPAGMSFAEAAEIYRTLEPTLPTKPAPVSPKWVSGLAEVLAHADIGVVVLDAYGVLNMGAQVIPGAVEAVVAVQKAGKPVYVVTNDASNSKEAIAAKHQKRGFNIHVKDLTSSADNVGLAMASFPTVSKWGIMAPPSWPHERLGVTSRILDDAKETYDWAEGFVFLSCTCWTDRQQALLHAAMEASPRPIVVGNPDVTAPDVTVFSIEPGALAQELKAAYECPVRAVGKPHQEVFDQVKARHPDIPANRFLMVGDTPHTDILGGRAAGMKSLLLTDHGFLRGQNVEAYLETCGIWPDYIAPGLKPM